MNSVEEDIFPEGWDLVRLEELSNISIGKTPPRSNKELFLGNNIWLSIRDLKGDVVSVSKEKITDKAVISSNMKIISEGTLLMSFKLTLGRTAFAGCDLFTNEAIASLPIKDETVLNKHFLKYALATIDLEKEVDNAVKGKTLNKQKLKNLEIPFPKLEEQKRIVAKIDNLFAKIDKAISLTEESLKQAKNLLPSVLKEVFEKGKADGWEEKMLTEICEKIFAGGDKPKDYFSKTKTDECSIPIFSNGIKEDGLYGYTKEPKVIKPSVTISARGTIGYTVYRTEPFVPIIRLIVLTPNQEIVSANFLMIVIKNLEILNVGSAIPQLTVPMIKNYSVLVPNQDIQEKISDLVGVYETKITQSKSKLEEQLAYLKQLKSSILSKAFKGEL